MIGATGADVSGGLARAHNARVHFDMIQLAWRSAGKGQRLAVIAARRRNLEPVVAAYLESANRRVVLVLHHDLSLRLQQRPGYCGVGGMLARTSGITSSSSAS